MSDTEQQTNGQEPEGTTQQTTDEQTTTDTSAEGTQQTTGDDPRISKLNRESARYRTERNELRDQLTKLEEQRQADQERWQKLQSALGMTDNESPEDKLKAVQETAAQKQAELEKITAEFRDFKVRQEIATAARKQGVDGELLTDILAGRGALSQLDPTAEDYASQVEGLVTETVNAHPSLATQRVPESSGNAPTPTKNDAGQLSRDDLATMTAEQINKAVREGKLDHILKKEA